MTQFGKFLVSLNFGMALFFLTWALMWYTQTPDWKAQVEKLGEDINSAATRRDSAQALWTEERPLVPQAEKERAEYQAWYADQLQILRTGKNKNGKAVEPVIRKLVRQPNGLLLDINDKKPENLVQILVASDPAAQPAEKFEALRSFDDYDAELRKLTMEQAENQKEIVKLTDKVRELTERIAGVKDKSLGLRRELEDQQNYKKLFTDEMSVLKPQLVARFLESERLKVRLKQLNARLKQLQDADVAANP
jgi:chromosome segregation ATPase